MQNALRRLSATLSLTPLLLLSAVACSDSPTGGSAAGPDVAPRFDIRDAARDGGTPGFYFLTPIAPALASYPGVFDAGRDPVVEICAWSGDGCTGEPVARFTLDDGTAGSRIVVDAAAGAYRVDWKTAGVDIGQLHRIRVLDGISELGHADARRPAAGETPASLKAQGIVPLGNAGSFPIRFRIEQNGAPTVTITAPADHAIVPAGTPLTLTGVADDAEEGDLSSQIVWRSSQVEAPLGAGASLTVALGSGRHTISASVTDAMGRTTTSGITVVASIISAPATLNVPFGGSASVPITLSEPAPEGGLALAVTSSAPGTASVSHGSITIPAGAQSANATIAGIAPGSARVTIANPEYGMATTDVTVTAQLDITQTTVSFAQGRTAEITIELQSDGKAVAAPAGGLAVEFTSVDAGCAIASPVTIPAGLVRTTASVAYGATTATPCSTVITASTPDVSGVATDVVTANVGRAPTLTLGSVRVGSGLQSSATISLAAPAPAGGLELTLVSSDAALIGLSDAAGTPGSGSTTVTIAAGGTSGSVQLHGAAGRTGVATVTATAPGYSTATVDQTVAPAAVELVSLVSSTTTFSADNAFYVRIGVLNSAGSAFAAYQNIQAGAGPLTVSITNSNASVARLVRTGTEAQAVTVQIAEGSNSSPSTVAAGGVAFDPIGAGSTVVAASAPGVTPINTSSQTVTVSAPTISVGSTRVGSGLQTSITVSLGTAAPADLPLTLTSSDPGVLLLSDAAGSVGSATQTITVPAGQSSRTVYLQGVRGQTGTSEVTVTVPGYVDGSAVQTVAPTAIELVSLVSSTTTFSADNAFYVRIGVLNSAGSAFAAYQNIQAGAGPLTVSITNSNASVARLVRTGIEAQAVTVQIAEGSNSSPSTVAAGGVAFDPLGGGTTTIAASAPGVTPINTSSQTVTVSAPTISVGSTRVGSGLQTSITITLGAPAPAGGVQVAVASSDAEVLRISNAASTAGSATTTLDIAAGQNSATVQLHGVAGTTGSASVTVSVPGYVNGSATQTVGSTALELTSLPSTTTTLSTNSAFHVRVGVLNSAGTGFAAYQNVQAGAGPLTVSIANGNATVGQLVRTGIEAQSATVQIAEGSNSSPSTVATGGVAFDPLGGGTTTIAASVPAVPGIAGASQAVTVNAPTLSVPGVRVGSGLQASGSVALGAPAPAGGLELTLVSSAPDVVRLSAAANVAGTGSVTVMVAAGQSSAAFQVHGVIGQSGVATITASAPGFTNGTSTLTVGQTALELVNLPASIGATAASSAFSVRVGVLNSAGTGFAAYQNVQAGAGPLTVSIANGNAAVGQLVRTGVEGQTVTVQIAEGTSTSPGSVAAGGVAFDPIAVGGTTVTAIAPSQPAVKVTSQAVTVK